MIHLLQARCAVTPPANLDDMAKYGLIGERELEAARQARETMIAGLKDSIRDKTLSELQEWRDEKMAELLKVIYE